MTLVLIMVENFLNQEEHFTAPGTPDSLPEYAVDASK